MNISPYCPDLYIFWSIAAFVLGCCIGSFLNVCIWRMPRGESVVTAPSHCPHCNHDIAWYENLPLVSWLVLRGKCSACRSPITFRYFFVELLTGILFFALFYKVIDNSQPLGIFPVYLGMAMLIITTVFIDYEHCIIPDKTTYPAMVLGIAAALIFPETWHAPHWTTAGIAAVLSMIISGTFMALFAMIGKMVFKVEVLGWGDVKYIAAVGACLGIPCAFATLLFGSIAGALTGIGMVILRRGSLKTAIPFGPYLATGTLLWMFFGEWLTNLYLQLFSHH
jgi:leader peptidase (prepilin peptidase)/N-methyltransferase